MLGRYCRSILRRREEAEEAFGSAMLNAYQALRENRAGGERLRVKPWLFRIAHNQCLDALRRRREVEELGDHHASREDGPADRLAVRAELGLLVEDLRTLSEAQRSALVLREFGGLSHVEIAESLETTPARAKALILQAREALGVFRTGRDLSCTEVVRRVALGDGRVLRSREVVAHLRQCGGASPVPRPPPRRRPAASATWREVAGRPDSPRLRST